MWAKMTNEIEIYRSFVAASFIRSKTAPEGVVFGNRGAEHARVVMDLLVSETEHELVILTGYLARDVHSALAFQQLILRRPRVSIRVIVDNLIGATESALLQLGPHIGAKKPITVRQLNASTEPHLALADGKLLRLETRDATREAIVALNPPDACRSHVQRFDRLWDHAGPSLEYDDLVEIIQRNR